MVAVARHNSVAMVDFHGIAVPTFIARKLHNTVGGSVVVIRRRTVRVTITVNVDAGVVPASPTHNVRKVRRPDHSRATGCLCC